MSAYIASASTISNPLPLTRTYPHNGKINCVSYNHNSRVLASCGDDSTIVLSHTETSEKLAQLDPSTFTPSPLNSISFTSKSDLLACGSLDGLVRIWDLRKKEVLTSFSHHTDSVTCVTWNSNDQHLASSSLSGDIVLHSLLTKVAVANFKQRGSAGIKIIQFSPFKKHMLGAGSENGSIFLWDCNTRTVASNFLSFHNSPVTGLAFSAVNHMLLCTSGLDQRINFYDTQDKKIVKTIEVDAPLTCISFCSDGHTLAGGTLYGSILLFDLRSPVNAKNVLQGHDGNAVNWLEFAKSRETRSRSVRDPSKEPSPKKEEVPSVTATRFRTIEEIKLEAKLRVDQKRRERQKEEVKLEEKPEFTANRPPMPISTSKLLEISREGNKSPLISQKEIVLGPSQVIDPSSPVKTTNLLTNKALSSNSGPSANLGPSLSQPNPSVLQSNLNVLQPNPSVLQPNPNVLQPNPSNLQSNPVSNTSIHRNNSAGNFETNLSGLQNGNFELEGSAQHKNLAEYVEKRLNAQEDSIFEIKEDIQNLHIEMIRQFMLQMSEFKSILQDYSISNSALMAEIQTLKEENERLKKTSF